MSNSSIACKRSSVDFGLDLGLELANVVHDVEGPVLQQARSKNVERDVKDTSAVVGFTRERLHG
jgi:hypothetical protein